jgi:ATPase subunit of ABC transporter with duplicated ATPase domains
LLVSHDEDLVDEVATRVWNFGQNHEIIDFKGAFEEYQAVLV